MYFSYEKKHRLLLFLAKEIHTVIFLLKKCQKELEGIQYGYNAIAEIVCTYDSYMYSITWSQKYSAIYRLLEQVLCYQARAEKVPANTVSTDNNYEYNNFSPALPH